MAVTYKFPTNYELNMVTQKFVADPTKFIGEQLMPYEDTMTQQVEWDELDNETGMTAPHTMDSDPKIVARPGSAMKKYEPLYFKESELIKESEILRARQLGTINGVIDLESIVLNRLRVRITKDKIRAEFMRWLAFLGGFTFNENGVSVTETFPVQSYTPTVQWNDTANAKILGDMEAMALLFEGTGASASGAKLYVNRRTLNNMLANTNANDISAFRNANYLNLNYALEELNKIFERRGLPMIQMYHEGFINNSGTWNPFLPTGKGVLIGERPAGEKVGKFFLTPSLHRTKNGMPAPGFFSLIKVNDSANAGSIGVATLGEDENPKVKVTSGFYGGPTIIYPNSVIKVNAY